MSYVQKVLQPEETVRYTASIHWIVYFWGALLLALALATFIFGRFLAAHVFFWELVAALFAVIGLFLFIPAWWAWWTTEIAVTDRRVISKVRWLSLSRFMQVETNEMQMDKVESVRVDQSLLGQFLNYGDVTILGTGVGGEPIKQVANPIELRNHISGR